MACTGSSFAEIGARSARRNIGTSENREAGLVRRSSRMREVGSVRQDKLDALLSA